MTAMQKELGPKGLEILCFPCNQFGKQEPGSNDEIQKFVTDKFEFKGKMMDKIDVNGPNTHPVWAYLKANSKADDVRWNFAAKFIIDKDGKVVERNGDGAAASEPKIVQLL
jgi:glutathione peroxidase